MATIVVKARKATAFCQIESNEAGAADLTEGRERERGTPRPETRFVWLESADIKGFLEAGTRNIHHLKDDTHAMAATFQENSRGISKPGTHEPTRVAAPSLSAFC